MSDWASLNPNLEILYSLYRLSSDTLVVTKALISYNIFTAGSTLSSTRFIYHVNKHRTGLTLPVCQTSSVHQMIPSGLPLNVELCQESNSCRGTPRRVQHSQSELLQVFRRFPNVLVTFYSSSNTTSTNCFN